MARTQGPSPRIQRVAAFSAIALLAAATAASFGRVFIGTGSSLKLLAAALASAAIACALERRNLLLATIVSAAAMIVAVGLLVLPWTAWHGLPTLETLRAMGNSAALVGEQAKVNVAPSAPLPPLMLAAVTAIWAAVFSAHALAFRASSPLLALLPPVALLAFADTVLEDTFRPGYGVLFLLGALAVVFVDGLRRVQRWGPIWAWPGTKHRLAPAATRGAGRVAVGALVIAGLAPLFLPGIASQGVIDLSSSEGTDIVRLDPQVAIATALNRGTPVTVFTVQTDTPTYYRMLALDVFDGDAWNYDGTGAGQIVSGSPLGSTPLDASGTIVQDFTVRSTLFLDGVPAAYPVEELSVPDRALTYDDELQTIYTDGPLENGSTYQVTSALVKPSPLDLETVPLPLPASVARWIDLPPGLTPAVRSLAIRWTQGSTSMYDQVRAIQDHLRYGDFQYSTEVDYRDDPTALQDFLFRRREGFCQQFASSMAMLLRSLGIPARVAVGFTPGTHDPTTDRWVVSTDDAHSWVEVWFGERYGWLRFEPTPGSPTDQIASSYYDQAQVNCVIGPVDCSSKPTKKHPGVKGPAGPSRFPPGPRIRVRGLGGTSAPIVIPRRFPTGIAALTLLGLIAAGLALVPPIRALRRRRRIRRASGEPRALILATYDVFTERAAELGFGRGVGETLAEYRLRIDASGLLSNGDLDRLTSIAARAAYSQREPSPEEPRQAAEAARTVFLQLKRGTGLSRRVSGLYRPDRG